MYGIVDWMFEAVTVRPAGAGLVHRLEYVVGKREQDHWSPSSANAESLIPRLIMVELLAEASLREMS